MNRLYLMRHAKAEKSDGTIRDFDRPLQPRGQSDAALIASRMLSEVGIPIHIKSSSARRTSETAEIVARIFGIKSELIEKDKSMYGADLDKLIETVQMLPDEKITVMLIGHNPGFSDLASYFSETELEMPTAGLVVLDFDVTNWSHVSPSKCKLAGFDYPSQHRTL